MLIRPITPSSSAICSVVARICSSICSPIESGGSTQAESPEWTPASSTCCMIPATCTLAAVGERVDVDLDRVLEEAVEQQRVLLVGLDVRLQVGIEVLGRVADLHRPAAEHVGGPDEQREADLFGDHGRLLGRERGAVGRVLDPEPAQHGAEAAAVLGQVDRVDRRAQQRHPRLAPARGPASAASGRRTGRSRPRGAPARRRRARPARSAARSRGGRRCRSRSRPSPGCS